MGGIGSGRQPYADSPIVEACLPLAVSAFAGVDVFEMSDGASDVAAWEHDDGSVIAAADWELTSPPGLSLSEHVANADRVLRISYAVGDGTETHARTEHTDALPVCAVERELPTVTTSNGETATGMQYYWLCPGCGSRREKLYLPPAWHSESFRCRECHGLTYRSSRISHDPRRTLVHRINNAREKVDADRLPEREAVSVPFPDRPTRMTADTYDRLAFKHMVLRDRYHDVRLLELQALVNRLTPSESVKEDGEGDRPATHSDGTGEGERPTTRDTNASGPLGEGEDMPDIEVTPGQTATGEPAEELAARLASAEVSELHPTSATHGSSVQTGAD